MKGKNMGVRNDVYLRALEIAEVEAPKTGFAGENWEAPVFDRARATVEVYPYQHGLCEIRVTQPGNRYDTTNNGRTVYGSDFIFFKKFVKNY